MLCGLDSRLKNQSEGVGGRSSNTRCLFSDSIDLPDGFMREGLQEPFPRVEQPKHGGPTDSRSFRDFTHGRCGFSSQEGNPGLEDGLAGT